MEEKKIEKELKQINEQLQVLGRNISFLVKIILQGNSEEADGEEGKLQLNIGDAIKQNNERFRTYVG